MKRLACLGLVALAGCAGTQPERLTSSSPDAPSAPPKCSACHLAPRRHGLAATQWPEFQKNHRRRIHLTPEEKASIYDFLIGGPLPDDGGGAK